MKKGYQVFISHSSSDKTIAFNICNYLENQAIKCWIAPRDMNYGDYANSLLHGIENSQIFLLILSKKANESPHVLREVNHALSNNLKIIPIRIEDIQPTNSMAYYLNTIHWFDAFNANKQIGIDKIVQIVQGVITETPIEVVEQLINPSKVTFKKSTIGLIITFFIIGFTSFYLYYKKNEYKSQYIKDVNLPDNKQVKPNESLHKKWVIQNIGLSDWNNLEMERVGTSEGDGLIKSTSSFQVPKTLTNEKVVLGVEIQMPSTPGSTIAYWKLKRKDNSFLNSFLLKTQNPIFTKLNVIDESGLSQDTNCPNGSILNVDTTFIKKWRITNITNKIWENVSLVRIGSNHSIKTKDEISLPKIKPKQSATIHVPITTPSEPATVTAHWQLVDSEGNIVLPNRTIYTTFIVVYNVKSIFGYSYKQCDM